MYGNIVLSDTCYIFVAIIFLSLLQSSCYKFCVNFRLNCYILSTDMPGRNRNKKVTCEKCGTQISKRSIVRQKTKFPVRKIYCTKCSNFSSTSHAELNYHIAKKHPGVRAKNTQKCKICLEEFSGFYALRKHRRSQHGIPIRTSNLDSDTLLGDIAVVELKVETETCHQYLVDSEPAEGKHCVFNSAMSTFNNSLLNHELDHVFNQLNCATNVIFAFGFVLRNSKDGICRYFYAHENNTVMERSELVCTQNDMVNFTERMQKMDIVDHCTRERANTQ